jgi:SEC-C motif-containing protein
MRSRYSAYVMGDITYLQDTWHPKTCPANLADEFHRETRWLGLSIKRHETLSTHTALVEFVARYRLGGQPAVRLHETSHFLLENGRWLYVDGKHD